MDTLTLQQPYVELIDLTNEIDAADDILTTAIESISNLYKVKDILSTKTIVTEDVCAMVNRYTNSIYSKLNYTNNYSISKEDYDNSIAVESFADRIKAIWEGIKKFFIKMWNMIKSLWTKTIPLVISKNEDYIESIEERIKTIKDKKLTQGKDEINVTDVLKMFNCRKISDIKPKIIEIIDNHTAVINIKATYVKHGIVISSALGQEKTNYDVVDREIRILAEELKQHFKRHLKNNSVNIELLNSYWFVTTDIKTVYDIIQKNPVTETDGLIKPMSMNEIEFLLKKVKDFEKIVKKDMNSYTNVEKIIKKSISAIDTMMNDTTKDKDEIQFKLNTINMIKNNTAIFNTKLPKLNSMVTVGIMRYLNKHLDSYQ